MASRVAAVACFMRQAFVREYILSGLGLSEAAAALPHPCLPGGRLALSRRERELGLRDSVSLRWNELTLDPGLPCPLRYAYARHKETEGRFANPPLRWDW